MLKAEKNRKAGTKQAGFTLLETLVAMAVLLAVGAIVLYGTIQMTRTQSTISNRTEMHTSVRSATELLQQEIGQAGRVSPPQNSTGTGPALITLNTPVTTVNTPASFSISPSTAAGGLYSGEYIIVDNVDLLGNVLQETVQITCAANPCTNPFTATFRNTHLAGVPIAVQGSFAYGIVPPGVTCGVAATPCGSDATHLKLFGDVNGDGNMVYVEYTCSPGTQAAPGFLYRNQVPWTFSPKPAVNSDMIMLNNLLVNPVDQNGNAFPCFQYQTKTIGTCPGAWPACRAYVTDVEVTLTEQTEYQDPTSKQFQTETKALLNVSPRNVFNAWELDSGGILNRVQPMPPSIAALAP